MPFFRPPAELILAASFAVATATLAKIHRLAPQAVTFVSTGSSGEDQALAQYLEERLTGREPDPDIFLSQVRLAGEKRVDKGLKSDTISFSDGQRLMVDIECCATLDTFSFCTGHQDGKGATNASADNQLSMTKPILQALSLYPKLVMSLIS